MPDGARAVLTQSILGTEITVADYLNNLDEYLTLMIDTGALDSETATTWANYALQTLGYTGLADYDARQSEEKRWLNYNIEAHAFTYRWTPFAGQKQRVMEAHAVETLPADFATKLPFFAEVAAPVYFKQEAINQAAKFGREIRETDVTRAEQNAQVFRTEKINEFLKYNVDVARAQGDKALTEKRYHALVEAAQWLGQQKFDIEQAKIAEEQETKRQESWKKAGFLREKPIGFGAQAPTGEEAVRTFLEEGRPGAMQGFIESRLPGVLEKYQREQMGARRAWFSALTQPSPEEQAASAQLKAKTARNLRFTGLESGMGMDLAQREATLGRPLTQQDVSYDEWLFLTANERATKAEAESRMYAGMPEPERPSGEDPLLAYLKKYPWQSEFFKLSPQQRGFNKALYAPSARWFT